MEFLQIWEILIRRMWIIISVFLAFFVTMGVATKMITPSYKAEVKLLVETSDTLTSLLSSLGLSSVGGITSATGGEYETDIALATLRPLIEELIDNLDLRNRDNKVMGFEDFVNPSLLNKILPQPYVKIDQYEDAEMLLIEAYSADPDQAAEISNELAELYINDRLSRTREGYRAARIFIENQMENVKKEYYRSLTALKDFKIKENLIDLTIETQNLLAKIYSLKSSYEENERLVSELDKEIAEMRASLEPLTMYRKDAEEFSRNELINNLKNKLTDLLITISEKSIDFTSEHPEYKQLEKEIETIRGLINEEKLVVFNSERYTVDPLFEDLTKGLTSNQIDREVAVAKTRLFKKYIEEYQKELLKLPIKGVESSKLELALTVNKETYQKLLEYLTQVGIAESMTLSDIKLVEAAVVPTMPDFPKKFLNYFLGLFLGVFWGLALAFFVEYIDNTVKTPSDLKHLPELTLLGTIPKAKQLKDMNLISNLEPISPIVEAFRTIRNSIRYATVDKPIQAFMVTSSVEGEGKSSLASNIAINLSMEDKSVILVDMDMRRPSLHKFFRVPNNIGLTNVLSEGTPFDKVIYQTGIERLDILPSGPVPPDPNRLVSSNRVRETIEKLKERYDYVIIDTPPVMPVNDAIMIGPVTDGLIYLLEAGKVSFSVIEHVKDLIDKSGINLLGVVLNKFKAQGTRYYYYYYRYYYTK